MRMPKPLIRTVQSKRRLRAALAAVCVLLALAGALVAINPTGCASLGADTWTVGVYLCGSDLETKNARATGTLNELLDANIPANVTVVVQTGGARTWRTKGVSANQSQRFVIRNHQLVPVSSSASVSMGSSQALSDFLSFCSNTYPADHDAIILWDHGGGPVSGVCFDEAASNDSLSLSELNSAFDGAVSARNGRTYDIVGLDACLMGCLETAQTLDDDASFLVASEAVEPGAGWDYGALVTGLGGSASGDVRGAAANICQAFQRKCQARGTDASATLSAIDLSQVGQVEQALDQALEAETASAKSTAAALFALSSAGREAESFGGDSAAEGYSCLVDLGDFSAMAQKTTGLSSEFQQLSDAVKAAVVWSCAGSAKEDATGLSLYYPLPYEDDAFAAYRSATPLARYAQLLEGLYGQPAPAFALDDAGTKHEDGSFTVSIAQDSIPYTYDLYLETTKVDENGVPLGCRSTDIDLEDDWDTGTFTYDGPSYGLALDGVMLSSTLAAPGAEDEQSIVFTAPIVRNGQNTYLRFCWVWDDSVQEGGYYRILGTWNGIDHVTGMSDRSVEPLAAGDVVGVRVDTGSTVVGQVTVSDQTAVAEQSLEPGTYRCRYVVVDVFGNEHASDAVTYTVGS